MLKINSKKANLSLLVGILVLAIIAFIVIEFRPEKDSGAASSEENGRANASLAAQSYLATELPAPAESDMVFGNEAAALKIFVYEDYSSAFSAAFADNLEKVRAEFGDRVAVIVRPYAKNSDLAVQAAAAVDCAAREGKWKEMRALLFAKVKNNQLLEPSSADYAAQVGLRTEDYAACLTNERKSGKIEQSAATAETYQVYGAPTVFVGDELIPGARPYEDYTDSEGQPVAGLKTIIARKINK